MKLTFLCVDKLHKESVICSFYFETDYSFSAFIVQPMSASVPLGETALFMCVGEGFPFWTVNGVFDETPANQERGVKITYHCPNFVVVETNLTIPATMENDKVSIQCIFSSYSGIAIFSPAVHLTVVGKLCIM